MTLAACAPVDDALRAARSDAECLGDGCLTPLEPGDDLPAGYYGLSLFLSCAFDDWPTDQHFDLADVMKGLVDRGQMAGWEVKERFYEIGSHAGLAELESLLDQRSPPR